MGTRLLRGDRGRWAAGVTLALAVTIDLAYGREASLTVTLVFGPFVASALSPPRDTAWFGVIAVALAVALGWPDGTVGTSAHLVRSAAVGVGAVLAFRLATERTRREAKLLAVTRVADTVQRAILRPLPPRLGPLRFTARYVSATTEASVGGDFYEAVKSPWGVRLVVGDVRGKGLDAVRLAASLLGEFRSRAVSEPLLGDVVACLDRLTALSDSGSGEDFATALVVEVSDGALTMVRCGHPQPFLIGPTGDVQALELSGTLPIGLGADGREATTVKIGPGSRALLYSDGAFEAHDAAGNEFDLADAVRRTTSLGPDRALDQILDALRCHAGGVIGDDVLLLLAEYSPVVVAGDSGRHDALGRGDGAGCLRGLPPPR